MIYCNVNDMSKQVMKYVQGPSSSDCQEIVTTGANHNTIFLSSIFSVVLL
uniref:Uncharacterized protein n=1 Tax=Rhizophora mucronata TaxID=61149 RepID=A0A2P2IZV2_RHIMU